MNYTFRDKDGAFVKALRGTKTASPHRAREAMRLLGIPEEGLALLIEPKAVRRPATALAGMFSEAVSRLEPIDLARISGYMMGRDMRRPDPICDRRLEKAGFHPEVVYLLAQQDAGGARFESGDVKLHATMIGGIGNVSVTMALGDRACWQLSHSGIETVSIDDVLSETVTQGLVGQPLSTLIGHRMTREDAPLIRTATTTEKGTQFVLEGPGARQAAEALRTFETQSVEVRATMIAKQLGIRQIPPGAGTTAARTISAIESALGFAPIGTVGRRLAAIEGALEG